MRRDLPSKLTQLILFPNDGSRKTSPFGGIMQQNCSVITSQTPHGISPHMIPHEPVRWALHAWSVSKLYVPHAATSRRANLALDADVSYAEGSLRLEVSLLLERIELDLKRLLRSYLNATRGPNWWHTLPVQVRRNAENRHRWTVVEIGRVLPFPDIAWLSMGDTLKVMDSLPRDGWKLCLGTETCRQRQFSRCLLRVKLFRDYHVAHPKPHYPSSRRLLSLCSTVQKLPTISHPNEWALGCRLLLLIRQAPKQERKDLIWEAMGLGIRSGSLSKWIALPIPDTRGMTRHPSTGVSRREASFRRKFLSYCAERDPGGRAFFGIAD